VFSTMKTKFLIRNREILAAYTENNTKDCVARNTEPLSVKPDGACRNYFPFKGLAASCNIEPFRHLISVSVHGLNTRTQTYLRYFRSYCVHHNDFELIIMFSSIGNNLQRFGHTERNAKQ